MGKSCLVTGKSGPLLAEVVRIAAQRDRRVLVTRSGHMELGDIDEETTSVITWNRRSALSARSVLLHAANLFGVVDQVVVVFAATAETGTFHESSIVSIEDRIDAEVKGYLFILREIFSHLIKQGSGTVSLVVQEPGGAFPSPLESAATGSFTALAESLCQYYSNEPVTVDRVISEVEDPEGYAEFVVTRLDTITDATRAGSSQVPWSSARMARRAGSRWRRYSAAGGPTNRFRVR